MFQVNRVFAQHPNPKELTKWLYDVFPSGMALVSGSVDPFTTSGDY